LHNEEVLMEIQTVEEYQKKEDRLKEINNILNKMLENDDTNLVKVESLREEAREIAKSLQKFIKIFMNS